MGVADLRFIYIFRLSCAYQVFLERKLKEAAIYLEAQILIFTT
jgi:hypothetical protein